MGNGCGRDRILPCIGRTGYPAKKSIRKAPAQKARRGWLRILTPRTSSEADPSILFLKTRTPPKPMPEPAGGRTEEQFWATDPSPASGPDSPRGRVCAGATRRKVARIKTAVDTDRRPARWSLAGKPRRWPVARCAGNNRRDPSPARAVGYNAPVVRGRPEPWSHAPGPPSCATAAALEGARPAAEKHNVCGSSCSSRGSGGAA